MVSERKVRAGDTILVHAGLYKGDRFQYSHPLGLDFDGTYVLTAKGTPERPIVIRAAGDGEAIFDGDGAHELFNVMAADYHIFEGLTIRNADIAFQAGLKDVIGAKGLTVRNCRMEDVGIAVNTQYSGSQDFYITDNVMIGRDDRYRLLGWFNPGIYGAQPAQELLRGESLRIGPRGEPQLHRLFPRRHLRLHARLARSGRGPQSDRDRLLQQ